MSKYTIHQNTLAEKTIDDDLNIIKNILITQLRNKVITILLIGSFGKGEGTVVKENKKYRPLNDYGIAILVKRKHLNTVRSKIKDISITINANVSVKQVDIEVYHLLKIIIPFPSTARYDFAHGNKHLYGKKIPFIGSIPAFMIPLEEGTRYYKNRGAGFLIARLLLDGFGDFTESKRIELAQLEINKAMIVIGDALLICEGKYNYKYSERIKRVVKLKTRLIDQEGLSEYKKAIQRKLHPNKFKIFNKEQIEEWFKTSLKLYLSHFLNYENNRLNKPLISLEKYLIYCKNNNRSGRLFLSKIWSSEDRSLSIDFRCKLFALLVDWDISKTKKNQYGEWQKEVLEFLLNWRNNGIISKLTS